jgi:hypothetical protein
MVTLKTQQTVFSVRKFLASVKDSGQREDAERLVALMRRVTRHEPKMWGKSIVGFGSYHYRYASGREGDWFLAGFSPRKQNMTVYVMPGIGAFPKLLKQVGKFKTGKGCLYFKRLDEIHLKALEALLRESVKALRKKYEV